MDLINGYIVIFILGASFSALISIILFSKMKNALSKDFAQIANTTIKNEQEDLRKQNREALEEKILPLTKQLNEFKDRVDKFNISGVENTTKIIEQIAVLEKNNKTIEQEAKNLTEALTKNQNIKGAYGEDILDTVLQSSGMTEGIHYIKQYSTTSENPNDDNIRRIRPDIVINLPDNRHLIIDSKVTLTSYLECTKDINKLKNFKSEVKQRIKELADKNYQNAADIYQPDFILMYMPIDSSVGLIYEDQEIIDLAYKSNIIIIGTASLLVAIKLVNRLFARKKQDENVQQIVKAGTNLYETFTLLCEELVNIQKDMDNVSARFSTAINRFSRPNKNKPSLFSQIEELKKYGINTTKTIPEELSDYNENTEVLTND